MSIITVGIDLAKNVFAVHGVDDNGKAALVKPKASREHLLLLIAQLPPCVIGMEACSGAHHWARLFRPYGHTVKRMAPKFVTPYRMIGKRGKNSAADAAAICEADGADAGAIQQWRQSPIGADHQGRRPLPAKSSDHGRPSRSGGPRRQAGRLQSLGAQSAGTARLLESGDRHCGEECAAGVGGVEVRRGVSSESERCLNFR